MYLNLFLCHYFLALSGTSRKIFHHYLLFLFLFRSFLIVKLILYSLSIKEILVFTEILFDIFLHCKQLKK